MARIGARTTRIGRLSVPLLVMVVVATPIVAAAGQAEAGSGPSRADAVRGLNYAGLVKETSGPCAGLFRVQVPGKGVVCSHGPDPAPAGVDVTQTGDTGAATTSTTTPSGTVPCIGDGVSGARVQVIYAVASGQTDNYSTAAPTFTTLAGQMDAALSDSATQTGGTRHIRFVTNPDCSLNVAHVILSPTGDDSFNNTIAELRAQGYASNSRKYLVMADATAYCGIAQVFEDDSAGTTNLSNTQPGFARVDRACWTRTDHSSGLHELMHTLGSVQLTAPHATTAFHCTDESDTMCYPDAAGVAMTYPCPSTNEWYLDCGHDDYFNTAPAPGAYLDTHWNTANSVFLASSLTDPTPAPSVTNVVETFTGSVTARKPSVSFVLTSGAGSSASALSFTTNGKAKTPPSLKLQVLNADGTVLAQVSGPSILKLLASLQASAYKLVVSGTSSVSFTLSVTHVSA